MRLQLALSALCIAVAASAARGQCSPATQKLINDQKYDEAKSETQALLKKNDRDDAALHCMGRILVAQDNAKDAIEWFEKAVAANDKVSAHHLWLANSVGEIAQTASKFKQPFMARRIKNEFDRAAQLDPTSIDARHGLIQFYSVAPGVMGGSMDKAKDQAREIGKLNAMRGHIEMGALLDREKDVAGAEKEFTAAVAALPDSTAGYNSLANFYRRQKRYAEAVSTYDNLLKRRPDAINAHINIGWTLSQSGQGLDRAEHEAKQWLAAPPAETSQPTLSFGHFVLGSIYEKQAKKDAARAEYQQSVTINPRNTDAKKALDGLK
jgi:tetratricopeptide (TPR) repeat protein